MSNLLDPYLIVARGPDGIYMAMEIAPGGIEGMATFAESLSDLVAEIVELWPASPMGLPIYTGADAELCDDLIPHLPAEFGAQEGRPAPVQETYL